MKKTILALSAAALLISGCASKEAEVKEHTKKAESEHPVGHEKHWDYVEHGKHEKQSGKTGK